MCPHFYVQPMAFTCYFADSGCTDIEGFKQVCVATPVSHQETTIKYHLQLGESDRWSVN